MTILMLSSTAHAKTPYDEWFPDTAEQMILFCPAERKDSYADENYLRIEAFEHYMVNPDIEMRALELSAQYNITHVLSISEFDVIRAAKIRALLNIEGQSLISAEAYRDKVLMKQLLQSTAVKTPHFDKAIDGVNIQRFVEKYGYPVVLKPIDGSGSSDVVIARKQQDIDMFLQTHPDIGRYEIEQFIDGEMYHIDGLVHNAEVKCAYVSHYYNGCLAFKDYQPLASYMLKKDHSLSQALQQEVKQVVAALPTLPNGSFHAEFFVTPTNDIYFCEIASRTGGGEIGRMLEHAIGMQLNQMSLYLQTGRADEVNGHTQIQRYGGFILLPPQNATFQGIEQQLDEDWVLFQSHKATPGQAFGAAQLSVDHIMSVVIEGEDEATLIARIDQVIAWYQKEVQWK
ncbi:ATP-grasp domain-containing protein [Staphylococcus coagulans]|uniref:ATP-grasp domain-containing protein n=1 Tax=Staphylococcus coagulans TaxID=74706 RepID=UPI001BE5A2BA|nr:ATP-grasp domain-containing protein [Staphylococcus coagulans]MBT2830604.1 ATP-grasp domain-containing protein [Staphylococcus coagulans]MBT2860035.1 ATP-grasp domain-containing protein [Staphylococcus coagulans]MBU3872544.1 ATP-grasp domain-containing protein [Staphylococcus coagulans]UNB48943.1 ATP-grasp domain-containing protein [Staphylococcus coagulans]